jgi:hypothetical protein
MIITDSVSVLGQSLCYSLNFGLFVGVFLVFKKSAHVCIYGLFFFFGGARV